MKSMCRTSCLEAKDLSEKLIQLANHGNSGCEHEACLIFFGIVLDAGLEIRGQAKKLWEELSKDGDLESSP